MNAKTTRTVWANAEKDAVFAAMLDFFAEDPHAAAKLALTRAQMVLDMSRRVVVTDQRVHTYRGRIEATRKAGLAEHTRRRAATAVPTPPPERPETPTGRLAAILDLLVDALADRVAARIADRLAVQVQVQTATGTVPVRPRHNPQPVSPPRQCRPGVVILGLLNQSGEQLRREFADRLDIAWYDSDDAGKRNVHPMAHVVLMTKFINHSIQERWRKAGVLHYCNGGISELRQILDSI